MKTDRRQDRRQRFADAMQGTEGDMGKALYVDVVRLEKARDALAGKLEKVRVLAEDRKLDDDAVRRAILNVLAR